MRYAMIRDGRVESVIEWDGVSNWTPGDDYDVIDCPVSVGPGWTHDGDGFHAPPQPTPPRRIIPKSVVQERMNDIGKLGAAFTALNSNPIFFGRWFAPDWPNVYFDDEGLLMVLSAIGCTPAQIETITAP